MRIRMIPVAVALLLGAAPWALAETGPPHDAGFRAEVDVDGIAVSLDLSGAASDQVPDLAAGEMARLRLDLRDTASGTPIGGAEPAAWMSRRRPGAAAPDCGEKVSRHLTGDLFSRADVDFNVYYILTLNDDATVSVVDPLFGFGGSRLLALVLLESPGADWVLAGDHLFVSQPEAGKVAMIRSDTWELVRQIDVGQGVARLRLQADGAFVWAGAQDGLTALDTTSGDVVRQLSTSAPSIDFVLADWASTETGAEVAFALLPDLLDGQGGVEALDLRRGASLGRAATGSDPTTLDASSLGGTVWVGHEDGTLVSVELSSGLSSGVVRTRHRLDVGTPLAQVRFAPGGRLGFALSPEANRLHVFDVARGRVIQSGPMAGAPEQVAFSDELAYVRHRDSEQVLMVPLDVADQEGEPIQAADFPGGLHPLGHQATDPPVLAPSFDRAPGASAMVLANADDRAVYFYMEGMAAPMGQFGTQGRRPLAVKVVDRSLRPSAPGRYETFVRMEDAGTYDLAVFLDAPRLIRCFEVEVGTGAAAPAIERLEVRLADGGARLLAGGGVDVELVSNTSADALVLYAGRVAGGWHRRIEAPRVSGVSGPGDPTRYRAQIVPGPAGDYLVWAEDPETGLRGISPVLRLRVPPRSADRGNHGHRSAP